MRPALPGPLTTAEWSEPIESVTVEGSVEGPGEPSGKQATSACRDLAGSRLAAVEARKCLRQSRPSR